MDETQNPTPTTDTTTDSSMGETITLITIDADQYDVMINRLDILVILLLVIITLKFFSLMRSR